MHTCIYAEGNLHCSSATHNILLFWATHYFLINIHFVNYGLFQLQRYNVILYHSLAMYLQFEINVRSLLPCLLIETCNEYKLSLL